MAKKSKQNQNQIPTEIVELIHKRAVEARGGAFQVPWYVVGWDWTRQPSEYRSGNSKRDYRSLVVPFRREAGWKPGEPIPVILGKAQRSGIKTPEAVVIDYNEETDDAGNVLKTTPETRPDTEYTAWRQGLDYEPKLRGLAVYTRGEYLPLLAYGHKIKTGQELEVWVRVIDPAPSETEELDILMDENNRGGVAEPFSVTDLMFRAAQYVAPPHSIVGDSELARRMGIRRSKAQKYYAFGRLAAAYDGLLKRVIEGLKATKEKDGTYKYAKGCVIPPAVFGSVSELRALLGVPENLDRDSLTMVASAFKASGQKYVKGIIATRATVEAFVKLAMGRKRNAPEQGLSASDLQELAGSYPAEGPKALVRALLTAVAGGSAEQVKVTCNELLGKL